MNISFPFPLLNSHICTCPHTPRVCSTSSQLSITLLSLKCSYTDLRQCLVAHLFNMASTEWPTLVQKIFLASWLAQYLEAGATGSYENFWALFFEVWFKVNQAMVAQLSNLEDKNSSDDKSDSEVDAPAAKKEKQKQLIIHLRGLTDTGRLAWQLTYLQY